MAQVAADLIVKMRADSKDAEAGLRRTSQGIDSFAKKAAAVGTGILGAAVFSGITRGFAGAATGALDFGAQMANVNSIGQFTPEVFKQLNDQVLALTSDPRIAQAPATLAAGLYDIQSSGFDAAHGGMDVLKQAALAATAGVTDTATAARAITANLNAFGLSADEAGRVSDVLFQTVSDGVITFDQLANNMGNVLPIANSLGLSVEEVGAAYANMTLKGVPASQAETQIAALMRSAINPTEQLTAAVQAHGFANASAAIESEGLAGFLDIVSEAAGGNQETMFDLLGTQEAMNAATILGGEGTEAYRKELDKMNKASKNGGATNRALAKQMESASFQIAKAKQQLLTLATVGIGIAAPAISFLVGGLTNLVSRGLIPFTNIIGAAVKGNFQFNKLLKDVPAPLRQIAHAVGVVVEGFSDLFSILRGRIGIERLPGELRQIAGGVAAIGRELLQGTRWAANIAIDTAVSLAGWLWEHKGDIWGGIKDLVGWGTGKFSDLVRATIDVAVTLGKLIGVAVGGLWDWIRAKLFGGPTIQDRLNPFGERQNSNIVDAGIVDVLVKIGQFVLEGVTGLADRIGQKLHDSLDGKIVADAVNWHLNLNLPDIEMPSAFSSGRSAGNWLRGQIVDIFVDNFSGWRMLLAPPAALLVALNFPQVVTAAITQKLTGMGPIEFIGWTLTVGLPAAVVTVAGFLVGLVDPIVTKIRTLGVPDVPLPAWNLDVLTPDISLGFGLGDLIDWVKDKVKALGTVSFDIVPDINVNLPNLPGGGPPPGSESKYVFPGPGGGGMFTQQRFAPEVDISKVDTAIQNMTDKLDTFRKTTATATLDADRTPFNTSHLAATLAGERLANTTFESTFDSDNGPAAIAYTEAFGWGDTWADARFTSTLSADAGPARGALNEAMALGRGWANSTFTATVSLNASPAYNQLAALNRELRAAGY